jgi:hypothetical protein
MDDTGVTTPTEGPDFPTKIFQLESGVKGALTTNFGASSGMFKSMTLVHEKA